MHPAERNHSLADTVTDHIFRLELLPGLLPPGRCRWPSATWPAADPPSLPLTGTTLLDAWLPLDVIRRGGMP